MSTPRTARDRVHQEVSQEILVVARAHLAEHGAAALSLRSIARDLEMAPSALYRYFDGRDTLLSALILGAYTALAETAEEAAEAAARSGHDELARWSAVPGAMRSWALGHPHEWGLIFGSPVPGYQAPEDTVVPYRRLAAALVRPIVDAARRGRLAVVPSAGPDPVELVAAVAPVRQALFREASSATVLAALQSWATLVGLISLELFGHWRHTVLKPELFFEAAVADAGHAVGLRPSVGTDPSA